MSQRRSNQSRRNGRRARRTAIAMSAVLVLLGACSSDDDERTDDEPAPATTTPAETGADADSDVSEDAGEEDREALDPDQSEAGESEAATTSAPTTAPPVTDEFGRTTGRLNYDGPAAFAVAASPSEVSGRPVISWEPVPDAATYEVVVAVADGERYWIWDGTENEVPIGGSPLLEEASAGARLAPGLLWWVLARDADGMVIAQTEILEVPG